MTKPMMLVIRDPDYENEYVTNADIDVISIDIGGMWNGYKHFSSALQNGDEDAVGLERAMLARVADLPAEDPIRERVEEFFSEARR